jgi:hypothetical protein
MKFAGNVDFSPEYKVVPGDPPGYFPPKVANPGAVADEQWSSIVVLPSGLVLNAQIVQNASGKHLRVKAIDTKAGTVTLSILDGVQGSKQYFYHLVTDASIPIAAVLEKGVFASKLAKIPEFGKSLPGRSRRCLASRQCLTGAPTRAPDRIKASLPRSVTAGSIQSMSFRSARTTTILRVRTTPARYGMRMSACGPSGHRQRQGPSHPLDGRAEVPAKGF